MQEPYLNLKNGLLFPIQFQILGYVFLFAGLALLVINLWAGFIFILLGGVIVSAFSGIEFKKDRLREYNAFLFIKSGKWEPLNNVEKIFIKRIEVSQKFYGRANQSSTIKNHIYKAFLKFENGNSVLVCDDKNKSKVEKKLKKLSDYLNTEIIDYTD